jgi:hypothetical protein
LNRVLDLLGRGVRMKRGELRAQLAASLPLDEALEERFGAVEDGSR